ncbi:IclR family transcriptional regulator [Streptomyces aurantiacus]|uniref:Putative transcriptional regulator KdgR n=1 Tax=Streptomyces aurantiacus JA 4570 TaxID=1286094 RepID=S4A2Q4_9ACTN|nr:IclR family transcriptional regulator [Streptomyces aurantiacus]EPH44995.1 putative transcriptional regulator KdgR [Streptomyces aurantiacus JA 4570]
MQNVLNTLRVLEELAARQPIGVAELARAMELPKSTVQRALGTLHTAGWIRPTGATPTRWTLTTKALLIGRQATGELGLRDVAVPVMEELRREVDETVHLAVPEGERVVLVERLETTQPVRIVLPLGQNLSGHASANGKAILAARTPDAVERYLTQELTRFTATTIDDAAALRAELDAVRARGYALNQGEWREDVSAVAAPVLGPDGSPVASVSINMPTSRCDRDRLDALGEHVRAAAREISAALGYEAPRAARAARAD